MENTPVILRTDHVHLWKGSLAEYGISILAYKAVLYCGWPANVAFALALGIFALASRRLWQGVQRKWKVECLAINTPFSRSLNSILKLKQTVQASGDIYLGEGFVWGPEHVQAFHEIGNTHNKDKHFPQITGAGGLPYIHNLIELLDKAQQGPQIHKLPEHTAIIGTTGIGKTRMFELIISQIIKKGEPVIIIDPKSDKDLLDAVYQTCLDAGREEQFDYVSLAHPQFSAQINPFSNYQTAGEVAMRITSIMPATGNSKPFVDFCYDVLATVADVLILLDKHITLKDLYKYAVISREDLQAEAREYIATKTVSEDKRQQLEDAIRELETKINHDKAHFQKMTTSLLPVLKSLTGGNIGHLLSPAADQGLTWSNIVKHKRVVYFSLASMRDAYVATNVGKLIVQDLVSYIGTIYTRQNQYDPLNLFVDEFYSVVYEGYTDIFNKSRAAGLRVFVGLQTTADIEAKVSDVVRRQMYGLISNKIYMRIPDAEQAQELVATLGTCQIPKRTVTRNVASNLDNVHDLFRSGYAVRVDLTDTDLLPVSVLTSLPKGHAILVTQGYPPIKLKIPLLDREGLPSVSYFNNIIAQYHAVKLGEDVDERGDLFAAYEGLAGEGGEVRQVEET